MVNIILVLVGIIIGLDWVIGDTNQNEFDNMGVFIYSVSSLSPFNGILSYGDLLLSCIVENTRIEFGNNENHRTPGVLLYYPINTIITIKYIKYNTTDIIVTKVTLNKSYSDVNNLLDGPLQSGRKQFITPNIKNNKIKLKKIPHNL